MHESEFAQDTESSWMLDAEGLGVGTMVHVVPSHRSARVRTPWDVPYTPTAMHEPSPGHDTEASELPVDPWGFGLGWIDQPVARGPAFASPATSPSASTETAMMSPTLDDTRRTLTGP